MANSFNKQPYESFTITADFSANLVDDETIHTQSVFAYDKDGNDVSIEVLDQNSITNNGAGSVSILVRDGFENMSPYNISFKIITEPYLHKWELDVVMNVCESGIW